jgi:hypothetical protein
LFRISEDDQTAIRITPGEILLMVPDKSVMDIVNPWAPGRVSSIANGGGNLIAPFALCFIKMPEFGQQQLRTALQALSP